MLCGEAKLSSIKDRIVKLELFVRLRWIRLRFNSFFIIRQYNEMKVIVIINLISDSYWL